MSDYLENNKEYWEGEHTAPNVDFPIFRFYGQVLRPDFGLTGNNCESLLDFGCGEGAAVDYFNRLGFKSYGVDINKTALNTARARYPGIKNRFREIDPNPKADDSFFDEIFDVITANQSLYYYSDEDLERRLKSLYESLSPDGVFYATMKGTKNDKHYHHSEPHKNGLREVNFDTNRDLTVSNYFVNFTENEAELKDKFDMFDPVHLGHYVQQFRSDERPGFHYTFVGTKRPDYY